MAGFMDNYGSGAGFTLPGMNNDGREAWADVGRYGTEGFGSISDYGGLGSNEGFWNSDMFDKIGQGLGGLSSLAQIYGMFQSLGLQKKAFRFAQEGTKRNFNASATGFNNEIVRRERLATAQQASNPSSDYSNLASYGKVDKWT